MGLFFSKKQKITSALYAEFKKQRGDKPRDENFDYEYACFLENKIAETMEACHQAKLKLLDAPIVSQRSELLAFAKEMQNIGFNEMDDVEMVVDIYIKANCG